MPLPAAAVAVAASSTSRGKLNCPIWARFEDATTGKPFFYNVLTAEREDVDPDPGSQRALLPGAGADDEAAESSEHTAVQAAPDTLAAAAAAGSAEHPDGDESEAWAPPDAWLSRPARVQREWQPDGAQYTEGNEHYNLWFGKYENDRFNAKEDRERAPGRCDPDRDSGYTQADEPGARATYFCLYFAQGICSKGHNCGYYHRVPSVEECMTIDPSRDIFGRTRFSSLRRDMDGVGSFNSESRNLYVGDLRFDRSRPSTTIQNVEKELTDAFGVFGELVEPDGVKVFASKAIAFVRFVHRGAAEFAKVAMANQALGSARCIRVKWALDDRNPKTKKLRVEENMREVQEAVDRHLENRGLSVVEIESMRLASFPQTGAGVTAPYPDTMSQFLKVRRLGMSPAEAVVAAAEAVADEAAAEADAEHQAAAVSEAARKMSEVLSRINTMHAAAGTAWASPL